MSSDLECANTSTSNNEIYFSTDALPFQVIADREKLSGFCGIGRIDIPRWRVCALGSQLSSAEGLSGREILARLENWKLKDEKLETGRLKGDFRSFVLMIVISNTKRRKRTIKRC